MTGSMMHRVKVAIRRADRDGIEAQARAAIEAMREPTEAMVSMDDAIAQNGGYTRGTVKAVRRWVWASMISAALSEKP